jgi:hypothetical protein
MSLRGGAKNLATTLSIAPLRVGRTQWPMLYAVGDEAAILPRTTKEHSPALGRRGASFLRSYYRQTIVFIV